MVEPIAMPSRLGQPCWTDGNLEATIRTIAAMGDESASRFLATHAPMSQIRVGDTERTLSDTKVFDQISRLSARESVVLVHGAPGTGKSHLINWVKLRYDNSISTGEIAGVLPVLVRRRTGSLKDALEQLVEQLPERFHRYLEPVQTAIDRISEREARKKLATEFHLEFGVRWEEAAKPPLPRTIRHLSEAFHAEGFGAWLCREGGVIDRNIQQLISPSELRDRESLPEFTAEEFRIANAQHRSRGLNTSSVLRLIDEFDDEPESAQHAANLCNASLRSALRELTGLGNAALSTILRSIRQDLRKENVRLILLIEDVSTLSVLDDEVVNAVEPQDDATLCDLTSVLGMTEQAYQRLRDNQFQRIAGNGLILSFPKDASASSWAGDSNDVDRFVARYLNASRLTDGPVAQIAEHRRRGQDIVLSACEDCPLREPCHAAFGSVAFNETIVGLFPFRPGTASYLLNRLDETQTGVRPTQRGLLDFVTKPVMRHVDALSNEDRQVLTLPVRREALSDWQTLVETYLGGWDKFDQARLRLLVEAWTEQRKASHIASELKSLLSPFYLPDFSARTADIAASRPATKTVAFAENVVTRPLSDAVVRPTERPEDVAKQRRLTDQLARLERWFLGGKLENPREIQEFLLKFLANALPTEDVRNPAVPALKLLRTANRGNIRIEDSATQAATSGVSFYFPRSEQSYDLMVALSHYSIIGGETWVFAEAERYKRIIATWLRKNQNLMLEALNPDQLSTSLPMISATKFLCMASIIERRAGLPADTPTAIGYVTSKNDLKLPTVLTDSLRKLYNDLPERRRLLQAFVVEEANVPQGAGGINVIDPLVVTEAISEARHSPSISPLPAAYSTSFWKSRYQAFDGLRSWANLSEALKTEREAIGDIVDKVTYTLAKYGFPVTAEYSACVDFIDETGKLIVLLKSSFQWPSAKVDFFKRERLVDRSSAFAKVLSTASAVAVGTDDLDVLLFNPEDLLAVAKYIEMCSEVVDSATEYADQKLQHLSAEGDPDALELEIVRELERIGENAKVAE